MKLLHRPVESATQSSRSPISYGGGDLKSLTAAASTAIQLIYVLTSLSVTTSVVELVRNEALWSSGDPKMMAGAISSSNMDLIIGAVIGLVGVILAWLVLRKKNERPPWFLPISTFFAWTWIVFVPICTVIGVLMLRWCRPDLVEESATQA